MAVNVVDTSGGALAFKSVIDVDQFNRVINQMESRLQGLTKSASQEAKEIDNLIKKTTTAIAAYASFTTATNFLQDIVRTRGEFQQLEVAFTTMLKSKSEADKLLAQATELAATTPFSLQDVASGAKQLLAYGFAAQDITATLRGLGDIAAGVGAPLNDIVFLYGTLRTQGRAYAKDIQQFAGRGIPIIKLLADQFKVAEDEVFGLVEAGKVGFPQVEQAFKTLTSSGGLFFNLMEEQSKTLTGLTSNLQDAWSRMLNEFGKSNEGVFADSIRGAISLVENYETVLDVLKVLIATYGTYKAAIIATSVAQGIATAATKGYTIAETLRFQAMLLSERAMKLLNATMLANPYVAVATGIAAVVAALIIFSKTATDSAEAQRRLNEVSTEAEKALVSERRELDQLLTIAKDEQRSKEDRLQAIKRLNQISPQYLGSITAENINTQEGIGIIDNYVKALERKARAQAASAKLDDLELQRLDAQLEFDRKIEERMKSAGTTDPALFRAIDPIIQQLSKTFDETTKSIQNQKNAIKEYYTADLNFIANQDDKTKSVKRTVAVIEEEIKAEKEKQAAQSTSAEQYKEYGKNIDRLQKELESITGKKTTKAAAKELKEREKDFEAFTKALQDAEAEARRSGLSKERSELDKINNDYDELLKKARELGLLSDYERRIENARKIQTGNLRVKEQFEEYKKSLADQQQLFQQYETAKKEFGVTAAKEMFGEQTKGFDSYLDHLEAEKNKVEMQVMTGIATDAEKLRYEEVTKAIIEGKRDELEATRQSYQQVLTDTMTFRQKELAINETYDEKERLLEVDKNKDGYAERKANLQAQRDEELKRLADHLEEQSELYQLLSADITRFTQERLEAHLKLLEENLLNEALPPAILAELEEQIERIKALLRKMGLLGKEVKKNLTFSDQLQTSSEAFFNLGDAISEVNGEMGNLVTTMGAVLSAVSSAHKAMASFQDATKAFKQKDTAAAFKSTIEGVGSVVQIISAIAQTIAANKQSERDARQSVLDFQTMVMAGEIEMNTILRERERDQIRLNKLKAQGLEDEKKLLLEQQQLNKQAYNDVLAQLQREAFIQDKNAKKGGIIGQILSGPLDLFGAQKTKVEEELASLANKSFEDLERLFTQGQLTARAKELFIQLQKIKSEGVDIDALLVENKRQAQEFFTGTTSESITDTIVEGFRNGKRAVQDFASDTEDILRGALLNALKYQALEEPIKKIYEQFAENAKDGLDTSEVADFTNSINKTIEDARKFAEQVEQSTGINLANAQGQNSQNSLSGAIKGIREDQANVLTGQVGGIQMSVARQTQLLTQKLAVLNRIQSNTAELIQIRKDIADLQTRGIKIRS